MRDMLGQNNALVLIWEHNLVFIKKCKLYMYFMSPFTVIWFNTIYFMVSAYQVSVSFICLPLSYSFSTLCHLLLSVWHGFFLCCISHSVTKQYIKDLAANYMLRRELILSLFKGQLKLYVMEEISFYHHAQWEWNFTWPCLMWSINASLDYYCTQSNS